MIDPVVLMRAVTRLCMLRFPPPEDCRPDIGMLLGQICHSEERLDWLVTRALQLYGEWPGPLELLDAGGRRKILEREIPARIPETSNRVYPRIQRPADSRNADARRSARRTGQRRPEGGRAGGIGRRSKKDADSAHR